jgi:hypothetical protein
MVFGTLGRSTPAGTPQRTRPAFRYPAGNHCLRVRAAPQNPVAPAAPPARPHWSGLMRRQDPARSAIYITCPSRHLGPNRSPAISFDTGWGNLANAEPPTSKSGLLVESAADADRHRRSPDPVACSRRRASRCAACSVEGSAIRADDGQTPALRPARCLPDHTANAVKPGLPRSVRNLRSSGAARARDRGPPRSLS